MTETAARASVREDFTRNGVSIALASTSRTIYDFTGVTQRALTDDEVYAEPGRGERLVLTDDVARALYEALAVHYGHTGHDMRALRKDYEHERGRVDRLTDALLEAVSAAPAGPDMLDVRDVLTTVVDAVVAASAPPPPRRTMPEALAAARRGPIGPEIGG